MAEEFEVVVVGAGFSGLYQLYKLRELGFKTRVFEAGHGVGGTWFWNRYPGARCDIQSMDYSYSFSTELEQEWSWSERYPSQPEILRYINHVADRFDLRKDIQFNTKVVAAKYDAEANRWLVETKTTSKEDGSETKGSFKAKFLIWATGCLSVSRLPDIPGLSSFSGPVYRSSQWPEEGVDLKGKRVGIIGTGSTGIQMIPVVAAQAGHLTVFQRTPNYSIPTRNEPLNPEIEKKIKADYKTYRQLARDTRFGVHFDKGTGKSAVEVSKEELERVLEERWKNEDQQTALTILMAFTDVMFNKAANDLVSDFVRNKIKQIVKNPEVAQELLPHDHPIGCKRLCVDTDYFDTYNRDNVKLVNIRKNPIESITPQGIRLTDDQEVTLDVLIFATGFDAMTGALCTIDVQGRDGLTIQEKWKEGTPSYLGVSLAGFPNMFTITGPGSPSVLSNMMLSIEQHVEWISDALRFAREHGIETFEAAKPAEDGWSQMVQMVANMTLVPTANSWYVGANIPGKPRYFMPFLGGVNTYREQCANIAAKNYEGFILTPPPPPLPVTTPAAEPTTA